MLHDLMRNPSVVIGLLVVGLVCALFAPYLRSGVGTPDEVQQRTVTMRNAGIVLAVVAAAILVLQRAGIFR